MLQSQIIDKKVAEIRPRFLRLLAQRLNRFEEIRDLLETEPNLAPLLEEIGTGAHSIVGLAATLGFPDLGSLAQNVELVVNRVTSAETSTRSTIEYFDSIDDLLGEMALILQA